MKVLNIIDKVLRIAAYAVFVISLIFLAFKWSSIPDIAGVHFASDGSFDVYDTKLYIFYPYGVCIVSFIILELSKLGTKKLPLGMKMSENGIEKLRAVLILLGGAMELMIVAFFTYWAECVMVQKSLNKEYGAFMARFLLFELLAMVIVVIVFKLIYKTDKKKIEK